MRVKSLNPFFVEVVDSIQLKYIEPKVPAKELS